MSAVVPPPTPPVDRSRPPLAGEVKSSRFPEFRHTRLSNGLDLYIARWAHYPLVNVQLLLPAGGQYDPPGQAGLASLHGSLLDEGTQTRTALEIASTIERLGGFLGTGADWDVAYVSTTVLRTQLEAGLELVADLVLRPTFPATEVKRLRRHRQADILRTNAQPATQADRHFARLVFEGTPYAEPLIGTETSVGALEREHFAEFYRRHVRPDGAALLAVGDVEPEKLAARLEGIFGDWRGTGSGVERPAIAAPERPALEIHVIDRPGSSQTQVQIGHRGIARNDPDHPKALLASAILGGKFTSRLNLNLRERHGVTYGTHSQFVYRQGTGPFVIRLAVATDSVGLAARETLHEIRRLREEPVPADELEETQDYLVGVFPVTLQTVSDLAKRLETLAVFDLPDDYYTTYPAVLRELGQDDVLEAAQRYFDPERAVVVAVGPAGELRSQLAELGEVRVHTP